MGDETKEEREKREAKEKEIKEEKDRQNQLSETLSKLSTGIEALATGFGALGDKIDGMKPGEKKDDKKKEDFSDIESLNRKDFLGVILKEVGGLLEDKISPLTDKIGGVEKSASQKGIAEQVKQSQDGHKDFWDWKEEMGAEVKKNPYLTPEDAYVLARTGNSKKAKEMDEKYEDKKNAGAGGEDKERLEKVGPFGGLTPTSGKTVPSENMSTADAAESSWNEIFGGDEAK